ncbi:DinB family protein [Mariniblastus fucicola]|uniref:DinB superfamily protein n=1 Tax=Mariniblastus fucicola TaxID=980251 RepID=A0A5B9P327_9BACT|nr:DinB family protein [Mariniblastus fucicola]QEG20778.1 DinB superfamily protein [Mariniblastus fucicola]
MNSITRPEPTEYFEYFETYIGKFTPDDFWTEFDGQPAQLESLLGSLPEGEDSKLHDPYTWTLKQVVGHLIDTERIFATRLLQIAVGDPTPNPDFEQNSYVAGLDYEGVAMSDLIEEFATLRRSNSLMLRRLGDEQLSRSGTASGRVLSARAIPFLMGGHVTYHFEIMQKRLGQ